MSEFPRRGFFAPDTIRVCTKTVMDNSDPDIVFDEDGVSNWWHEFHAILASLPTGEQRDIERRQAIAKIKSVAGKDYDCVLGISGGVDSCYMAYLSRSWGLRPLVVHFDNGWNDELAVRNIEVILKKLDLRLNTFVMNWPEFRDLQRAYFKASVIDLEVPTDHMIFGALHQIARKHGIRYVLSGNNFATEWVLPRAWHYAKSDLRNLQGIHRAFGERPSKHLPKLGVWQQVYYQRVWQMSVVQMLELIDYRKTDAKRLLIDEFGWQDYGGKHFESVFTRFFQSYILPMKWGVDKRKAHLSNLILNGEITRDDALDELAKPADDPERQQRDKRYVAKKLGWSDAEFDAILALPPRRHEEYGTDARERVLAETVISAAQPFASLGRSLLRRLL